MNSDVTAKDEFSVPVLHRIKNRCEKIYDSNVMHVLVILVASCMFMRSRRKLIQPLTPYVFQHFQHGTCVDGDVCANANMKN